MSVKVGAGKSTLFAALLGDSKLRTRQSAGDIDEQCTCYLAGSVAYCAQTPWIFPGTIKVRGSAEICFAQRHFTVCAPPHRVPLCDDCVMVLNHGMAALQPPD